MAEKLNQNEIFIAVNSKPNSRIFRNNVGNAIQGVIDKKHSAILSNKLKETVVVLRYPRWIKFGLHVGSGDLIGWITRIITPDMVGKKIAQFLSIEVKSDTGVPSTDQKNWREQIKKNGGCAGIAKTIEDAEKIINEGI
jgi:hypothetical protein